MPKSIIDVNIANKNFNARFKNKINDRIIAMMSANNTLDPTLLNSIRGVLSDDIPQFSMTNGDGDFYAMCGETAMGDDAVVYGRDDDIF